MESAKLSPANPSTFTLLCIHYITLFQEKLSRIKSVESVLGQYKSEKAAVKAIIPVVYSESLQDAVINLSITSISINKVTPTDAEEAHPLYY